MMHFWDLQRLTPLDNEFLANAPMFTLSNLYLETQATLERAASRGRILRWVLRKSKRLAAFKDRLVSIAQELQNRYEGILGQMIEKSGEPDESANASGRRKIWGEWVVAIPSVVDPRDFSPTIWHSHSRIYGNTAIRLKEKLMLRQFIDSLPLQHRMYIVVSAFDRQVKEPSTTELSRIWGEICTHLDNVMTTHRSDLDRMTHSCISGELLNAQDPHRHSCFKNWLYAA